MLPREVTCAGLRLGRDGRWQRLCFGTALLLPAVPRAGVWKDERFMNPQQGHFLTSSLLFYTPKPNVFLEPQIKTRCTDKRASAIRAEGCSSQLTPQLPWFLPELSFSTMLCRYFTFSFLSWDHIASGDYSYTKLMFLCITSKMIE